MSTPDSAVASALNPAATSKPDRISEITAQIRDLTIELDALIKEES